MTIEESIRVAVRDELQRALRLLPEQIGEQLDKQLRAIVSEQQEKAEMLRKPEVVAMVSLSGSTINKKVADGSFPKPQKIGSRAVAWRRADIEKWIADCSCEGNA